MRLFGKILLAIFTLAMALHGMGLYPIVEDACAATVCVKSGGPTPTPTATATPTATPTPVAGTITLGGQAYTIASHPRFISSGRLTTLQARSVAGKRVWDRLTIVNDGLAASCSNPTYTNGATYALAVGFLSAPAKTTWRDCAKTLFNKIKNLTTSYDVPDYGRMDLADWAFQYDFLANSLTTQEKSDMRDFVFATWIPWIRTHTYDVYKGSGDCISDPLSNLCITSLWGQYMFGMACMGEDYRCDNLVTQGYDWYRNNAKTAYDAMLAGGHTANGSNYGRNRVIPYIMEFSQAEVDALGISASWTTWMAAVPQFFIHSTLPYFTNSGCSDTASNCDLFEAEMFPGTSAHNKGRDLRAILLPIVRDPTQADAKKAQYWMENVHHVVTTPFSDVGHILSSGTDTYGKEYLAEYHLNYNQDGTAVDYTGWDTTYFAGTSHMYSRDAWGSGDKFWMSGDATQWFGDHQTTGCGGIKVFKNGEFGIVENDTRYAAGTSDQTGLASFERSTLTLGSGLVTYQGAGSYQTGGFGLYGQSNTCLFAKTTYGASFAYYQANLDAAYRNDIFPATMVRRNVFHLKPTGAATDNYVVVLDAATTTNSITVTQQFYVPKTSPTVSDPDVSFTLTNTKTMLRRIYGTTIAGNSVSDASGAANPQCPQCGSGMNRITNVDTAGTTHFSGTVISMQGTGGSMPTTTTFTTSNSLMKGVRIQDANIARIVAAPVGTTATSATFTYSITWTAAHSEHIVCGLTAADKYDVTYSSPTVTWTKNNATGAITVDAGACARFTN